MRKRKLQPKNDGSIDRKVIWLYNNFGMIFAVNEENVGNIAHIFTKIPEITKSLGLTNGYRIVNNCGEDGCQSVKHMHFHILGGKKLNGTMA